jgi:hypothetical protein
MLDDLTSAQLSEWQAYESLEPFGEWRADYRIGQLCALVLNIAKAVAGEKGKYMPSNADDFMLSEQIDQQWAEEDKLEQQPVQTIEEMKKALYAIAQYSKKAKPITTKKKKR